MITPLPGVTRDWCRARARCRCPGIMAAIVDETGTRRAERPGRHPRHQAAVAVDDPHDLGRSRALQEVVLPGGARRQALPRRRRRGARQDDRLLHDHGPHRRRAERLGPPAGHDGDRVGAGRESDGRRSRRRRPARRHDRRGRLRVRRAEAGAADRRPTAEKIAKELRDWVGKEIGPIAKPKDIRFGDNLPKTRSGKIMRRLLRSIAKGEEITQDMSTLENPAILDQLKQAL